MKYFLAILIFLFSCELLSAQPFGNEWINYSQNYYKIKITKEGVYRLYPNVLTNAGIDVNTIDPRSIQLFRDGVEQYIFIPGENDGKLDAQDFIEFYATGNDGRFDTQMYENSLSQANPAYSLFNDTAVYFVTFNNSIHNKRMTVETDNNFAAYTPSDYFFNIARQDYTDHYFLGFVSPEEMTDPDYILGEGWFDNGFGLGGFISKTINTKNIYTNGPSANVECVLLGQSDVSALNPDHHIRFSFSGKTYDTIFDGFKIIRLNYVLPASTFSSSKTTFDISSINDLPGNQADRGTVAYISIKYPHTFQMENDSTFKFYLPDSPQLKSLLNFSDFAAIPNDTVRLYDLTNHKRILVYKNKNGYSALIPNSGNEKICYLTSDHAINLVSTLIPVGSNQASPAHFTNYISGNFFNSNYIIITNKQLMQGASQYSAYRNSTGYKTLTADVDELYDQYAHGIGKHPLGIRNFIRNCYLKFSQKPKYLFLIGKGYRSGDDSQVNSEFLYYRKDPSIYNLTLVPGYGAPPSDILFSVHLDDSLYHPALATGRLAATSNADVQLYLNKVKEHELALKQSPEWLKNVLHFGGGIDASQQFLFKQYLNNYKQTIEDTMFGGYVRSFFKTSSSPFQINRSDSLTNIINNGVAIMTFFGHAAGIGFDESIDDPSEYNNKGKYPFLLANSCFAGDLFSQFRSSSETYILIPDKGAVAYLGSISRGMDYFLNLFSQELYKNIAYKNYNGSLGISIQNTIKKLQQNNFYYKNLMYDFMFHGDPALTLSALTKPDYAITPQNIYFSPANVTGDMKNFKINIIATNMGKAIHANYFINIIRTYPDGSQKDTTIRTAAPLYKDTVSITLDAGSFKGVGLNTFKVTLDAWNEISEISKLNNTASVNLPISSYDITPVYPYEYAIVPSSKFTLKAYTGDPFAPVRNYIFEIDTTDSFIHPLSSGTISHAGGLVTWTPQFTIPKDSTVIYWRVGIDSSIYGKYNWRESSFQYMNGKSGWGQSHFFQFKKDNYQFISYNHQQRSFTFSDDIKSLNVQTGYYPYIQWQEELYKINGAIMSEWSCTGDENGGMKFAVLNPTTVIPWYNTPGNAANNYTGKYKSYQCNNDNMRPDFDYFTNSAVGLTQQEWFSRMKGFIDSVPVGYYFLAFSHREHNGELYPPDLVKNFKSCGCQNIHNVQNNFPYICFGKKYKDTLHASHEVIANSQTQIIQLVDSIKTKWNEGHIISTLIGPSLKWNSLHWRAIPKEYPVTDSLRLKVLGIKMNGEIDTVISNLPPVKDSIDILNLQTRIDAKIYPFIQLVFFTKDNINRTPAFLKRWQVLYDEAPETAIDPSYLFSFYKDTIKEGEKIKITIATHNISDFNFADTIVIHYWLVDQNRTVHEIAYKKNRLHPANDIIIDSISYSTIGLRGMNNFWVEVNPINPKTGQYYQSEQYHFNNIILKKFFVGKDNINPLLDVTFDGMHILNNDIVSGKPEILMTLNDENKYLLLNDTSLFRIYLKSPIDDSPKRIFFQNHGVENMKFSAATLPKNTCRIEWNPVFKDDGEYELLIKAVDKSGNISGNGYPDATGLHDYDYSTTFQVINKSTITEVLNWPNPFSTSTRFVFILTGNEVPTYFKIQIMTITGRIVKEITQDEFGPIHIGRNISEYTWNGTDQFGDRLANGVYLYHVVTNINGNSIEKRNTEADHFFKKGWGKMYLMR